MATLAAAASGVEAPAATACEEAPTTVPEPDYPEDLDTHEIEAAVDGIIESQIGLLRATADADSHMVDLWAKLATQHKAHLLHVVTKYIHLARVAGYVDARSATIEKLSAAAAAATAVMHQDKKGGGPVRWVASFLETVLCIVMVYFLTTFLVQAIIRVANFVRNRMAPQ